MVSFERISSLIVLFIYFVISVSSSALTVGYYRETCPQAEDIVREAVEEAVARDRGLGASLIRMHFHDCFVRGCDASILLDSTVNNPSEKEDGFNDPHIEGALRGYEIIDRAKSRLESQCPHTVSCADVIAFAARDSAHALGRIGYGVPAGRRDGRISNRDDAKRSLPSTTFNMSHLKDIFVGKGLSLEDMATLLGAHSVGRARCGSFTGRLYAFNSTHKRDPSLDPTLVTELERSCPEFHLRNRSSLLDHTTPYVLDNVYYRNLFRGKGVLPTDQLLVTEGSTVGFAKANAEHLEAWALKFAEAMVKMGYIDILVGSQGEIRKNCRIVN